jgi:hypothetical protein
MACVTWKSIKVQHCERVDDDVALQARVVYPASFLPEQPPRILAHRCSKGLECNQIDKPTCLWAGTLPGFDPFI